MFDRFKRALKKGSKKGTAPKQNEPDAKENQRPPRGQHLLNDHAIAHPVKISLHGGNIHTSVLRAEGPPVGKTGTFKWYRSIGTDFTSLPHVRSGGYVPSLDDVGSRITTQWIPDDPGMVPSSFGEAGPLTLDPQVERRAQRLINKKTRGRFRVALGIPSLDPNTPRPTPQDAQDDAFAPNGSGPVNDGGSDSGDDGGGGGGGGDVTVGRQNNAQVHSQHNEQEVVEGKDENGAPAATVAADDDDGGEGGGKDRQQAEHNHQGGAAKNPTENTSEGGEQNKQNMEEEKEEGGEGDGDDDDEGDDGMLGYEHVLVIDVEKTRLEILSPDGKNKKPIHEFALDQSLSVVLPEWGPPCIVLSKKRLRCRAAGAQGPAPAAAPTAAPTSAAGGAAASGNEKVVEGSEHHGEEEEKEKEDKAGSADEEDDQQAGDEDKPRITDAVNDKNEKNKNVEDETGGEVEIEEDSKVGQDDGKDEENEDQHDHHDQGLQHSASNGDHRGKDLPITNDEEGDEEEEEEESVILTCQSYVTRDVVALACRRLAKQQDFQPIDPSTIAEPAIVEQQNEQYRMENQIRMDVAMLCSRFKCSASRIRVVMVKCRPFGMRVANMKKQNGSIDLVVEDVGGPAQEVGIMAGDVILKLNGQEARHDNWATVFTQADLPFPLLLKKPDHAPDHDTPTNNQSSSPQSQMLAVPASGRGGGGGDSRTGSVFESTPDAKSKSSLMMMSPKPLTHHRSSSSAGTSSRGGGEGGGGGAAAAGGGGGGSVSGSSSMEVFLHRQLQQAEQRHADKIQEFQKALDHANALLQQESQRTKRAEERNAALQADLAKALKDLREAVPRAHAAAKAAQKEDMQTLKNTMKQLNKTLADVNRSRGEIEKELKNKTTSEAKFKARVEELDALHSNSTSDVANLTEHLQEANSKLKTVERKEEHLRRHTMALEEQIENLKTTVEGLNSHILSVQRKADDARIELREVQKANKKKDEEIKDLEAHCAHLKASKDALEREAETVERAKEVAVEARESNAEELHKLQDQLHNTSEQIETFKKMVSDLESKNKTLEEQHKKALDDSRGKTKTAVSELSRKVNSLTTQRNRYKKKAESLSSTVRSLMKDKASSASGVAELFEQKLATMTKEKKAAMQALDTYKKAFEQQLMSKTSGNKVFLSNSRADKELLTLRRLANGLSETINDKDEVIVHMRRANKMLGARIQELEKQVKIYEEVTRDQPPDTRSSESTFDDRKSAGMITPVSAAALTPISARAGAKSR